MGNMNEMKEYIYTSQEKIYWWGHGEWVNEPDLVTFRHLGIECKIIRISMKEPCSQDFNMFGGYLNGYIEVPKGHCYYHKEYNDMNIDCHGGLTFGESSDRHWVGFDCAHSCDYVPSIEHIRKNASSMKDNRDKMEKLKKMLDICNSPLFNTIYKNIQFCMDQCKSMAEQLMKKSNEGK